ncbi:MAG: putative ski2-type helicase [Methanoregula sp. PtaU1.Bin051]|nr:MAG: putative ski2-type helicase [Methanoregula sp. PtaU1.Bin051]
MAIADLLHQISANPVYRRRAVHTRAAGPELPRYGILEASPHEAIAAYLSGYGIRLYTHQCDAINACGRGSNIIITTPTASGKTLAFNIPVLSRLAADNNSRALYIYPTKALANDQLATLERLAGYTGIDAKPAIYDGDTPQSKRAAIREHARIVLTNPYELHQVLPWHVKWQFFLSGLSFVVIDEAHRYRGVFGSHVSFLIRRLLRLCRHYGSDPQIVLSSATLANPAEFSYNLTGRTFEHIADDGSPRGRKHTILFNPFYDGIAERSTLNETKDLLLSCVKSDLQTLCFTGSRKMTELVALWAREDAKRTSERLAATIASYRAGYLPEERRLLERQLKEGRMKGLVATNALELGIDVGSLDAVIIAGYPGTMMSTRQQAGRAGRNGRESVAILVAKQDPLDQFFMNHPDEFFSRPSEHIIVDSENPYIVSGHILCAAAELPLRPEADSEFFGESFTAMTGDLVAAGLLRETRRGIVYTGRGRATDAVRLDGLSAESFRVVCSGNLLETMDRAQAYREAHDGAIMLHQGVTYIVTEMDLASHTIRVAETDVDYYTQPMKEIDLSIIDTTEKKTINGAECAFGDVEVTERYTCYKIKRKDTVLGVEPLDLPPLTFRTKAFWFVLPTAAEQRTVSAGLDLAGGLHGAEHAIIAMMPLFVLCDRWDIGGLSVPAYGDAGEPTVFVYDGYEGGIGLAEKAFGLLPDLFSASRSLVRDCRCDAGCPSCIYSPKCGNDNVPLDKEATITILDSLAGKEEEKLPLQEGGRAWPIAAIRPD